MIARANISDNGRPHLTYGLTKTPRGFEAKLSARTREEFYRDAVTATLEVAYGGAPPAGEYEGAVVPIQAAGDDDIEIVKELVDDCLLAVDSAGGTLHPPRWLSFDTGRVTANLPGTTGRTAAHKISLKRATPVADGDAPFAVNLEFALDGGH